MHRRRQLLAAAAAVAAIASTMPVASAASAASNASAPKCFGKKPTIVVSGSHKTVKGTKHADVIDALGTGDTVLGGDGNDRICVGNAKKVDAGAGNDMVQFASGTILGGKGNDTLVQKGKTKGKTAVFGGDGNDTIVLSKPNALVDSGNGLDILTVPPQYLDRTTIVDRDGLIVNGVTQRIDAPHGAPSAQIAYDGDTGPVVFAQTVPASDIVPEDTCCDVYDYVTFGNVLPKNGRFLSAWSVNFGDGYVQSGQGGLPSYIRHPFTSDGSHVITATQTDSAGGITVRQITVNTASGPDVHLGTPTGTGGNISIPVSVSPGSGATITSYFVDFGDGTFASGPAPVPTTLGHTYASADFGHTVRLTVVDDHGNTASSNRTVSYTAGSPTTTLRLAAAVSMEQFIPNHSSHGELPAASASNPATVFPDETITLYELVDGPFSDFASLDWGDGCSIDLPFNAVNPVGDCGQPFGPTVTHSYAGPGPRTITARIHRDANPADDVVATWSVNVVARQTVAQLTRNGVVPQGHVSLSTAGTTIAAGAAKWFFNPGDGSEEQFGDGAPPAVFDHVYPSGLYYPRLDVVDHYGASGYAYGFIDATSVRARIAYFGGEETDARWVAGLQATDASGSNAVCFSGALIPSIGAVPKGAQLDFGDGTSEGSIPGFADGEFSCQDARHGYTRTGEYTAVLAARDSKGQVASAREHVSIATRPTLGFPETMTVNAAPSATTVPVSFSSLATIGTNASAFGWSVDWQATGPTSKQGGYGMIPGTLSFSYPNPGPSSSAEYFVDVMLTNDHYGSIERVLDLTVNGA